MTNTHVAFGNIRVKQESFSIQKALTEKDSVEKWLGVHITGISDKELLTDQLFSWISEQMNIIIDQSTKSTILWTCSFKSFNFSLTYKLDNCSINIELACNKFSVYTFLQEWIYLFYRLQDYIEGGIQSLASFNYGSFNSKDISVSIPIHGNNSLIFAHLTQIDYLNQIFSKYPECNLNDFRISWGWIDEGPSNLVSWKKDEILIHDFILDFNPIGYIKWEIEKIDDNNNILRLTHKDIDLLDEINQDKAYFSYKNGWLYFLAKIRDLVENSSFTIHFMDEIID